MSDQQQKPDKTFVNGMWIKEQQFPNGGSCLKVNIHVARLVEFLNQHVNPKGYVNLDVLSLREPKLNAEGKVQSTHYSVLDTWQPKQSASAPTPKPDDNW